MSNSQLDEKEVYETNSDTRLPYQTPQLLEISLVEGRIVLGICKTGSGSRSGSNSGNCINVGVNCKTLGSGS